MIERDKVKGMIYGLAIGDALGAPTEFMSPKQISDKYGKVEGYIGGGAFRWEPGESTDDTDQALMLARALKGVRNPGDVNRAVVLFGKELLDWSRSAKDIGGQTRRAINTLALGYHPLIAGLLSENKGGAGNGSIMRTAPVAVPVARQIEVARSVSQGVPVHEFDGLPTIFSSITHAHPTACMSCEILVSVLVDFLLGVEYDPDAVSLRFRDASFTFAEALQIVSGIKDGRYYPGGYSITTLAWGLWAAEKDKIVFDFVLKPVNQGGDADTNAAVAGAVLGAKLGFEKIPGEYVEGLKKRDEIDKAINGLLA